MLYYRLCRGLTDIGDFYPVETSPYSVESNLDQELFKSVYYYTKEQVDEANKIVEVIDKKTKKPYNRKRGIGRITTSDGVHHSVMVGTANQIIFDFDALNPDDAFTEALLMVDKLAEHGISEESIEVLYSGNKGAHLKVPIEEYLNSVELKSICTVLMDGLNTCDTTVYNDARILRLPYSRHHSGYYTTPLTIDELVNLPLDEIKLKAVKQNPVDSQIERINIPQTILKMKDLKVKNNIESHQVKISGLPESFDDIDFAMKPTYLSPAKYVMEMGYIPPGYGQEARMILAASYKKAGKNKEQCYHALKAVSDLRVQKYGSNSKFNKDEVWDNVVLTVYSESWQGGTYSKFHPILLEIEARLPVYLKRSERATLIDNLSVFDKFRTFAKDIDKNTLQLGIPSFDEKVKLLAGTAVGILGSPASGKSTFCMNLLAHNSLKGEKSIFYSLDMGEPLVALKQIQRKNNLTNDQIFEMAEKDPVQFKKLAETSGVDFENVMFSFKFGITPDDIRNDIQNYEQKTNEKIRLVVVDYLENITSGYSDPIMGAGIAAQQLADVANEMNVLMVILLQTQKTVKTGEEITSMRSIKGSSVIEQCLSVAFGIWREGQPIKYQPYDCTMGINVLKNRYGPCSINVVGWNGARSKIMEITPDQQLNLDELRRIKAEEKEENDKKDRW